jgi:predicted SAM-dependent methyltransferase
MSRITDPAIEVWITASELDISKAGNRLRIRHRSLVGEDSLEVRVKPASWVLDLLDYLRVTRTKTQISDRFPYSSLNAVLIDLRRNGVIFRDAQDEQTFLAQRAAIAVARRATRLSSVVRVLGADLGERMATKIDKEVIRRTNSLSKQVGDLVAELEAIAATLTAEQVAKVEAANTDLKVHLGCGSNLLDSWVNIDIDGGDVHTDLRRGLPLPDGSAQYIYSCHMIEHLTYPSEVLPLLREACRVLRPGGVFRIVVPNIEPCLRAYVENDREFFAQRAKYWPSASQEPSMLAQFLAYFGASPDALDQSGHKYGYDFETLAYALTAAGFEKVHRSAYQASKHSALHVDDRSNAAPFTVREEHLSLFVEAERSK